MRRRTVTVLWGVIGVLPAMLIPVIVGSIVKQARAESPAAQHRAALEYVSQALQAETTGKNSHREALLQEALEAAPDLAAARWPSGYVRADNRWMKFDDVPAQARQNPRLAAYRRMREKYRETATGQLALAEWCKKAGLRDQWRAHLGNVLALNPDHQEARSLLGYRLVDGIWLTPHEIEGTHARSVAAIAALNKWKPKLLAIRDGLESSNPNRREVARKRLAEVQDAAAVPPLELVFCVDTAPRALVGVNHFAEMPVAEASLALARQALFSHWPAVRKAAVQKLKTRNRETYVPELLAAMHAPTQSRIELFQDPEGRLLYRHAFYRQGQERDELAVFDTIYDNNVAFSPYVVSGPGQVVDNGQRSFIFDDGTRATLLPNGKVRPDGPQTAYSRGEIRGIAADPASIRKAYPTTTTTFVTANLNASSAAQAQAESAAKAIVKAQAREMAVANQNAQTVALNSAICQLLSDATGENGPQSSEDWSDWWVDTDEVYVPGYKPLTTTYEASEDSTELIAPLPLQKREVPAGPIHYSCLAAGTPIWTDAGPVAVEKIKVGDRVLSQHPETGELAYKPVLHTTVRLNAELVKLELLDDTVTCSVGHGLWIAGKGWVKARDIQPKMHFHGAAGTTPLRRSEPAGVGPVYNLIVADFHSYFVGKALIFSHDITARKPSDLLVPGLNLPVPVLARR